jgi:hypothetical protein
VATRAVRLLAAQLGLLRADAANAHLRMLSASLAGSEGIRCRHLTLYTRLSASSCILRMLSASLAGGRRRQVVGSPACHWFSRAPSSSEGCAAVNEARADEQSGSRRLFGLAY